MPAYLIWPVNHAVEPASYMNRGSLQYFIVTFHFLNYLKSKMLEKNHCSSAVLWLTNWNDETHNKHTIVLVFSVVPTCKKVSRGLNPQVKQNRETKGRSSVGFKVIFLLQKENKCNCHLSDLFISAYFLFLFSLFTK